MMSSTGLAKQLQLQACPCVPPVIFVQQRRQPTLSSRARHKQPAAYTPSDSNGSLGLDQQQQQQQLRQMQPYSTREQHAGVDQYQQHQQPSNGCITASLQDGAASSSPQEPQQPLQQQRFSSTPVPQSPLPQQQEAEGGEGMASSSCHSSSSSSTGPPQQQEHQQQQQQQQQPQAQQQRQPWPPDVPWGLDTVVGVLSLWLLAYVAIGQLLVPAVLSFLDLERAAMSARELALLNLSIDCFQAALTLLMLAKCLGRYRPRTRGLFPLRWQQGKWLTWVAAGVGCFPVIDWVWKRGTSLLTGADVQSDMFHTQIELGLYTGDIITISCYVIIVGVLAPLWEEVLFRGFLLPSLAKLVTPWPAVTLTALLFAWMHSSSEAIVPLLLVALGCGALLVKFDNLLPPILLHGLYNLYVFANMAVQLYCGCGPVTASLSVAFGAAGVLLTAAAAMHFSSRGSSSSSGGGSSSSSKEGELPPPTAA